MTSMYQQNFYIQFEINHNKSNIFPSTLYNNCCLNEHSSKNMLKQKRIRNKKDKHEYQDLIEQYYNDESFENSNYDYSQKSNSEFNKKNDNFNISKLKDDLMPK